MMDYKREMSHAVHFMTEPMIKHLENNHKPFTSDQGVEYREMIGYMDSFFNLCLLTIKEEKFENIDQLINERDKIFEFLQKIEKSQIKRIKNKAVNTRNSQLYFKINSEIRNLLLHLVNLIKSQRDFISNTRINK
jgi:Na+/phosphate symporter